MAIPQTTSERPAVTLLASDQLPIRERPQAQALAQCSFTEGPTHIHHAIGVVEMVHGPSDVIESQPLQLPLQGGGLQMMKPGKIYG